MASLCSVKISSPARGLDAGANATFVPAEACVTWSWGLQPATALIEWVSPTDQPAVVSGQSLQIDLAGHTFYGMTDNFVRRTASNGYSVIQEFRDNREYLMWDEIYAQFNIHDARIINGQYRKRYRHLLPADYNARNYTFTDTPYTAAQILDFIFGASTVQSPWIRVYHSLMDNPVFDLDYDNGQKLGNCLVDISDKLGLVFTLAGGPYRLFWALKGVGTLPDFPATSDDRRIGSSLSGNPTRVRILGDRNRYQIFNVPLVRDWKPAWEAFWNFGLFIDDLYANESTTAPLAAGPSATAVPAGTRYNAIPGDADGTIGYGLAGARARLLTVAQYAALRDARSGDGDSFRDYRRFQGRSRLQLPVALYLAQLLFRAFKVDDSFTFRAANGTDIGRWGYELDSRLVVETTHDPVTGVMSAELDADGNYRVPSSEHNGYAVVLGYQVAQDGFGTLNPDYFDYQSWLTAQQVWQVQSFQVDASGEGTQFILFDEPVINSGDLIRQAATAGPTGGNCYALNGSPTFAIPQVKATLTFLGDRFSWIAGTGTRDDVENLSGLNSEYLVASPGGAMSELPFADGERATVKADAYAALLLNRQFYYFSGGYCVQGVDGSTLSSLVDRITLRWNAQGLSKEVDWTTERSRSVTVNAFGGATLHLEPERAFERRAQLDPLFPGQDALRTEARQLKLSSLILRQNPRMLRTLVDTFHLLLGQSAPPNTVQIEPTAVFSLAAGTPLFRDPTAKVCWKPDDASSTARTPAVFAGITTIEPQSSAGGVRATTTGAGGVVQARVMGPVAVGDSVGLLTYAKTYLEGSPSVAVGQALEAISGSTVALIKVRFGGTGGGTSTTDAIWI